MSRNMSLTFIVSTLAVASVGLAQAQEQRSERAVERLELTMTLLPEQARDAAEITRRIELPAPPPAAEPGADKGQKPEELPGL